MKSKAYYSFVQKLFYFDDDIELIDVLRTCIISGDLTDETSTRVLKRVDPERHKHIRRRRNSNGSRELMINHLRSSVYSSYVKDIYEEVTEYLKTVLRQASRNGFNSGRIIGEHSFKIDATTVLALGDWDSVCRLVTDSVFQTLEAERSTLNLLRKTATKLSLTIDAALIDAALPYLEVRHFLVHADGLLSTDFRAKFPNIRHRNGYVLLDYTFISEFRDAIKNLMEAYDAQILQENLLAQDDIRDG